jgi:hypothetical protein
MDPGFLLLIRTHFAADLKINSSIFSSRRKILGLGFSRPATLFVNAVF